MFDNVRKLIFALFRNETPLGLGTIDEFTNSIVHFCETTFHYKPFSWWSTDSIGFESFAFRYLIMVKKLSFSFKA